MKFQNQKKKLNNGKIFPRAFREYLFLGGEFNNLGFDCHGIGFCKEKWVKMKEYYEEEMPKYKVSLNRPYVILHSLDGVCFMFIYLDEGDDPQVYNFGVHPDYRDDNGDVIFFAKKQTFSELINRLVDYALRGLQPW